MSRRTILALALGAAFAGAGLSAATTVLFVKTGPAGPPGKAGPQGPEGPEAETGVAAEDVQSAVDEDPDAVAASLSGHLDYEDIQQNLDPDPADVATDVDDLRSTLDDLCSQLSLSDALSDVLISC